MIFFHPPGGECFSTSDYSSTDYNPYYREGVKMFVAFLAAILIFSVIILYVWRLVKEKTAEEKERGDEVKKATPDPNEFH
jgi:hypothetical protein